MKSILKLLRKLFPSFKSAAISAMVGVCAGLMSYINCFQRHFFSKLYLGYTLIITVTVTIVTAFLREYFLNQKLRLLKKHIRILVFVFSFLFALLVFVNVENQYQPLYFLLPDSYLQIRLPVDGIHEGQETIRLLRIDTGQGYIHYSNMRFEGDWKREDKNLIFLPGQETIISWEGKVGPLSEIVFRKTTFDQPVYITWNGVETEYNLNDSDVPNVILLDQMDESLQPDYVIQDKHEIPFTCSIPIILSSIIFYGFCFLVILVFLGTWQPFGKERKSHKYAWLAYMLPMLIVWGFSLLVFWPGIVSNDSITSWTQATSGPFTDWQSAFYSLLLSWLIRVWYSPGIVSILQVLVLSFLVAWELKTLRDYGVHPIVLFAVSILFAILPINNLYVITLWRDVPYAIAFLWLTVLVTKIYLSDGEWIKRRGWLWLALAGFLVSILRQNGIPVAVLAIVAMIFVYRKYTKEFVRSLVVFLCLLLFVKGPVYSAIKMDRSKSGQENLILLHHIAAHVDAGTELNTEEEEYLDSLQPLSDWFYYSCYVGTISYDDQFGREEFLSNSAKNREIALDLFLKDPSVDVYHMLDASELVWRFANNQCIMKSLHGFSSWKPGEILWVIPNDLGIEQDSWIPSFVQPYADFLRIFGIRDDFLIPLLRPALYLFISVIAAVVLLIRRQDPRALLLSLPILLQSAILFLISYAPAVRYQYSNYLVGLFLLAIVFVPGNKDFVEGN